MIRRLHATFATGRVIGRCYQRHRAVEFRKFLDAIDQAVPASLDLHLVLDNYATHKTPAVKAWLARHPRYYELAARGQRTNATGIQRHRN